MPDDNESALADLRQHLKIVKKTIASLEQLALTSPGTRAKYSGRGRKSMGHAERVAVSERMKKYWAKRRQG